MIYLYILFLLSISFNFRVKCYCDPLQNSGTNFENWIFVLTCTVNTFHMSSSCHNIENSIAIQRTICLQKHHKMPYVLKPTALIFDFGGKHRILLLGSQSCYLVMLSGQFLSGNLSYSFWKWVMLIISRTKNWVYFYF